MKINRKFLEQLVGSLSKDKIANRSKEFGNIFDIINTLNPQDNKIDIEEITNFVASIWQEDDGDGKLSNKEIESYISKNEATFEHINIKARDIRNFLKFYVKNSDKTEGSDIRIDNDDGTYSVITQREEFEERDIIKNQKEIDAWDKLYGDHNKDKNRPYNHVNDGKIEDKQKGTKLDKVSDTFSSTKNNSSVPQRPRPVWGKTTVSKGFVERKINYSADNQVISTEETRGAYTTITDPDGNLLQKITKNEGAKDTIKDYTFLEDGTEEESIFYGEDGIKDSQYPAYKNVYKNNELVAKYEYDSEGQIVQRQNIKKGKVYSVTKYNNGVEGETVQLFTNTDSYANPDQVFDNIIDPAEQNFTGDCWLLDGLSKLSKKSWGRQAIADATHYDPETGNITVKFKHAYGDTKEFTITQQELAEAKNANVQRCYFSLNKGTKVYVDGKHELTVTKQDSYRFDVESVKDNITFVLTDGKKYVWDKESLQEESGGGKKYSSGDLTVLAIELAVERSRQEVGLSLDGGIYEEVLAMFTDVDNTQYFINEILTKEYRKNITGTKTNSEKEETNLLIQQVSKFTQHIQWNGMSVDSQTMLEQMKKIMQNPDRYSCELGLKMDNGGHAGQILRFEQKDGKDYIVYTHPWDEKAEITEELEDFVKNRLLNITIVEMNTDEQIDIASDSQVGTFQMGNKSNRTNFASAIAALGQNPSFKPNIQKEGENYIVTIKGEKITITPDELETARTSGRYSTKDDDIPILELAVERYINKTRHNNTMYDLSHTNLEDVKIQDILNLFSDNELKPQETHSLKEASKRDGLKFVYRYGYGSKKTYYAVKEITQAPDGTYMVSVIQPENTSVTVTYTENEFRRLFGIEIYN